MDTETLVYSGRHHRSEGFPIRAFHAHFSECASLLLQELFWRTELPYASRVHHEYPIVMKNGLETVSDGDDYGSYKLLSNHRLDLERGVVRKGKRRGFFQRPYLVIKLTVYLRGRLVQDYDLRPPQQTATESEQLTLSCTQRAALADWHIQDSVSQATVAVETGNEMAPLQNVEAFQIGVLAVGIPASSVRMEGVQERDS